MPERCSCDLGECTRFSNDSVELPPTEFAGGFIAPDDEDSHSLASDCPSLPYSEFCGISDDVPSPQRFEIPMHPLGPYTTSDDTDMLSDQDENFEYTTSWNAASDTRTSASSDWSDDIADFTYVPEEEEPVLPQVTESFHFRGAQYDTVRTIYRPNPSYTGPAMDWLVLEPTSKSPFEVIDTTPFALSTVEEDSALAIDSTDSRPLSPKLDPCEAATRGLRRVSEWLHFEEEVVYRGHEWCLEQAGCGRIEIWVNVESRKKPEWRNELESMPRVFFPPPRSH